jgi:threonine/homoserine/homoserine lactone efflux protein
MTLLTLILFIPACFALNMIPGPNNLLSMSNGQRYGFQYALIAGVARLAAFVVLIALAGTGFATLLYMLPSLFLVIKVVGAVYIFWIAYQLWCSEVIDIDGQAKNQKSLVQLAKQEFLLAVGNPKAILVFTAFFPQFINPAENTTVQFALLGAVFLALELMAIAIYACFGLYLRRWFSQPMMRKWFNRGCAAFLGFLGLGLLLERSH